MSQPSLHAVIVAVLLSLIGLAGGASTAHAVESSDRHAFLLSIFDCYMPIPKGFVLNTHETRAIALFPESPLDSTELRVRPYSRDLASDLEIVSSRQEGALTIEEVKWKPHPETRLTRIHDERQELTIMPSDDRLVRSLLDGCSKLKDGDLYVRPDGDGH